MHLQFLRAPFSLWKVDLVQGWVCQFIGVQAQGLVQLSLRRALNTLHV